MVAHYKANREGQICVTVYIVNDVLDIFLSDIEPTLSLGDQFNSSLISGMDKLDVKLLILFDIEKVWNINQL